MKRYRVRWHCISCGQEHSFLHTLGEFDDWPNKFEDLKCENRECGQRQDVRFAASTVEEA